MKGADNSTPAKRLSTVIAALAKPSANLGGTGEDRRLIEGQQAAVPHYHPAIDHRMDDIAATGGMAR